MYIAEALHRPNLQENPPASTEAGASYHGQLMIAAEPSSLTGAKPAQSLVNR